MGIPSTRIDAPDNEAARRRELRAFLMNRRARLKTGDVGLPDTRRRRTPGLRREEVAALAGVSTAWYTLFEMAKETRVSRKTLDGIARALQLTPAETRHLYLLAGASAPALAERDELAPDPVMALIIEGYRLGPALLLNDRTDVLAMNDIAVAILGDLSAAGGYDRNWLWLLVTNRLRVENGAEQARELAAMFRATYCEHAAEADYRDLLDALLHGSEDFRRSWNDHDVGLLEDVGAFVFRHPELGILRFTFRALPIADGSRVRCCFLVPDDATLKNESYRALLRAQGEGLPE